MSYFTRLARGVAAALVGALAISSLTPGAHADATSKPFHGVKVTRGTVTCAYEKGQHVLTLSNDFVVPDAPAPHWRLVDSKGQTYLLDRLVTKGDVFHKTLVVPMNVPDVAKVQIWCAWAEVLLGETDLVCKVPAHVEGVLHRTGPFAGAKANKGFATHTWKGGRSLLSLSDDFVVPDTPAPHWQVVDSKGNAYLLNRLVIKGDKLNRTIEVPAYVPDVARVQIWCAFAETLLGEASFDMAVM